MPGSLSERRNVPQPPDRPHLNLHFKQDPQEMPTRVTANKCRLKRWPCLPGMRTAVIGICKVKKKTT